MNLEPPVKRRTPLVLLTLLAAAAVVSPSLVRTQSRAAASLHEQVQGRLWPPEKCWCGSVRIPRIRWRRFGVTWTQTTIGRSGGTGGIWCTRDPAALKIC